MRKSLSNELGELSDILAEFSVWAREKDKDSQLEAHFSHIAGNLSSVSGVIIKLTRNNDYRYAKQLPHYVNALKAYREIIDTNESFGEKELQSTEGYFPEIPDTLEHTYKSVKIGGSAYYALKAKEKLSKVDKK